MIAKRRTDKLAAPFSCVAALLVASCIVLPAHPPPIGRDLPREFAAGRPVFDRRVRQRFPIGSDEAAMRAELERERFRITPVVRHHGDGPYQFIATRSSTITFGCDIEWTISWAAKDGKITDILGVYGDSCF